MNHDPFAAGISVDRNLPLPDQLAELRSQIKLLRLKEKQICERRIKMGGERGVFTQAIVSTIDRTSLDAAAVRKKLGKRVREYERTSQVTRVLLEDLRDD